MFNCVFTSRFFFIFVFVLFFLTSATYIPETIVSAPALFNAPLQQKTQLLLPGGLRRDPSSPPEGGCNAFSLSSRWLSHTGTSGFGNDTGSAMTGTSDDFIRCQVKWTTSNVHFFREHFYIKAHWTAEEKNQ
jgi:hypothetical protein